MRVPITDKNTDSPITIKMFIILLLKLVSDLYNEAFLTEILPRPIFFFPIVSSPNL